MRNMGYQISEDGVVQWRNNGGCVERKFLYVENPKWENVSGPETPKTPSDLEFLCDDGGFEYCRPGTRLPGKKVARIFQEVTGLYHYCDDALDYLDARGIGVKTVAECCYFAREYGFEYYRRGDRIRKL